MSPTVIIHSIQDGKYETGFGSASPIHVIIKRLINVPIRAKTPAQKGPAECPTSLEQQYAKRDDDAETKFKPGQQAKGVARKEQGQLARTHPVAEPHGAIKQKI